MPFIDKKYNKIYTELISKKKNFDLSIMQLIDSKPLCNNNLSRKIIISNN